MEEIPYRLYHVDGTLPINPHDIWVFGSNLAGIHGLGAAKIAKERFNAAWGIGKGMSGRSYAIPTKDIRIRPQPFLNVMLVIEEFVEYTLKHRDMNWFVTAIGCGYAGFTDDRIAPLFRKALNCNFPDVWKAYLDDADALANPL